jgi:adenine-specific DNA-methyltransferase
VPRGVPLPDEYLKDYPEFDAEGNRFRLQGLRKRGSNAKRADRPSMYYPFYVSEESGSVSLTKDAEHPVEVLPRLSDGSDGRWRWGSATAEARVGELKGRQVGKQARWDVYQIDYLERDGQQRRSTPKTVWDGPEFANEAGGLEVKKLLGAKVFDHPKPLGLLTQLLEYSVGPSDLILDFFAGSGTTGHAVVALNRADGGRRRCISVNLPEPTPIESVAFEAGYSTVSEITYARLRAAMVELNDDQGLRVLALGSSSFESEGSGDGLFSMSESTIVAPTIEVDAVAAEILIKEGVRLDAPWRRDSAAARPLVAADGVAAVVSLDLDNDVVAAALEAQPRIVVFLEDGFAGRDSLKANAVTRAREVGITMKTV